MIMLCQCSAQALKHADKLLAGLMQAPDNESTDSEDGHGDGWRPHQPYRCCICHQSPQREGDWLTWFCNPYFLNVLTWFWRFRDHQIPCETEISPYIFTDNVNTVLDTWVDYDVIYKDRWKLVVLHLLLLFGNVQKRKLDF